MSPASAWVSSPPTGPPRSSAATPPRRCTTPGGRRARADSSSPPMRPRAGIGQALELHDQAPRRRSLRALRAVDRPGRGPAPDREPRVSPDAARRRRARPGAGRRGPALPRRARQQPGIRPARSARWTPSACRRSRPRRRALPDDDPRRAQVLALLACELHYAGEPARCRRLAAEAIEIARAAGDPAALAHTLANAMLGPSGCPTRCRSASG